MIIRSGGLARGDQGSEITGLWDSVTCMHGPTDSLLDAAKSKSNALSTVGKPCFESDSIMMIAAKLSSILKGVSSVPGYRELHTSFQGQRTST